MMDSPPYPFSFRFIVLNSMLTMFICEYIIGLIRLAYSPLSKLPGPRMTKYSNLPLKRRWIKGERAKWVRELHEKYGPVVRISPNEVVFASSDAAKQIHSYRQPFPKSDFYEIFKNNGADSVFNTRDFDYHSQHRRLLSAPMAESNIKKIEEFVIEKVDLAVKRMGEESKSSGSVDVMKWWLFMATDIIGELSFGDSFRMLELGKKTQYALDLGMVGRIGGLRAAFPTLAWIASFFPLPIFKAGADASKRITSYALQYLDRYQNLVNADPDNVKPTLFTKLFQAGEETMPKDALVANARAYIIAGSDTTATTLTYLTWALSKNWGIKNKLLKEVNTLPPEFDDEQLKKLPYLNQVIWEALRVFAPVPSILPREVPKGGATVDGYFLPAGVTVSTEAYSMHRNPEVFPDPDKFDPSRWDSHTKDMKEAWVPFGGGPRICLGMHLAFMELRHATVRMLRAYPNIHVSSKQGFSDEEMQQVTYFLMIPKNKRCIIETS